MPNLTVHARPNVDERDRLLAAAEQLLAETGFDNFHVRSVARRAQMSVHRFYGHFSGKWELLALLLERQFQAGASFLAKAVAGVDCPVERVQIYLESVCLLAFDQRLREPAPLFAKYWRVLWPHYHEIAQQWIDQFVAPLRAALEDGRRSNVIRCGDPVAEARTIYYVLVGIACDQPHRSDQAAREALERIALPFIARSLGLGSCQCRRAIR